MNDLIKELEETIQEVTKTCKGLSIYSTEYHYWNGVRCQAEVTLNSINKENNTIVNKNNFKEWLKKLMLVNNINANEVINGTGINQSVFSKVLNGNRKPSETTKIKIENFFQEKFD